MGLEGTGWWERFTRPSATITDEQEALRARLFVSIYLSFLPIILVGAIVLVLAYSWTAPGTILACIALALALAYILVGRSRWYRWAIIVSSISTYIWFVLLISLTSQPSFSIMLMSVPLVFISLFWPTGITLVTSLITAILFVAISLFTQQNQSFMFAFLSGLMLTAIGGGITLATQLREHYVKRLALHTREIGDREAQYRQLFESTPLSLWVMNFSGIVERLNAIHAQHGLDLRQYLFGHPAEMDTLVRTTHVLDVNRATSELFEISKDLLLKYGIFSSQRHLDENRAALIDGLMMLVEGSKQVEFELVLYTQNRRRFDAAVRWTPAPGYDPVALTMIVSIEDITARKEAEQQRVELAVGKETMQVIQRFVGDVSHDLLTPLSVIKTSAYIIGKKVQDESAIERLNAIDSQVGRVETMVRDMMMLARLEQPVEDAFSFQSEDIDALLAETVSALKSIAAHNDQQLTYERTGQALIARHDREKLTRAFANIVNNSLKYTPRGGCIWVRSRVVADEVVIEVEDTGEGIPVDELSQIFNRFYRAKEHRGDKRGLGLGLAIVQKIVEAHQGKVEIESTVGKGTTIRIRLPLAPKSALEALAGTAP
jgi:signal transduction histidine kinase